MKKQEIVLNDNCFDVIRAVCAFTVFLGHFLTHFNIHNDILLGAAYFVRGVPVFFFLSGLFVARSLDRYKTAEYLKRRAIRIFPELWVCVLLNLLIILGSVREGYGLRDILIYLGTQLTAFQFYTGDWLRGYGVGTPNGALWTITVDIQFYIVAILLAKWLKNKRLTLWGIVILLAMIVDVVLEKGRSLYPETIYKLVQCNLLSFLWIFLAGMCLYYKKDELVPVFKKLRWIALVMYFLWSYALPGNVILLFEGVRYNLITTILMLVWVTGFGFSFKKRFRTDYSYSFYLYHMVVINVVVHYFVKSLSNPFMIAGCFVGIFCAIMVLAVLSQKFIANKLSSKIMKRIGL